MGYKFFREFWKEMLDFRLFEKVKMNNNLICFLSLEVYKVDVGGRRFFGNN